VPHEYLRLKSFPSMLNFNVGIINGRLMFQLQCSYHQAVDLRIIKGNYIPAAYIQLKVIYQP